MKTGDLVHYIPFEKAQFEDIEFGIVKSVREEDGIAFVVFKCDGKWDLFNEYTGQSTKIKDLNEGWNGKIITNTEQYFWDCKKCSKGDYLKLNMKKTFKEAGYEDLI